MVLLSKAYNQQQKTFKMEELSGATLTTVMQVHNITRIQAQDMWRKITSFSKILERKYVDTYMDNLDTIITLMQEYKQKVLDTYKKKHPQGWRVEQDFDTYVDQLETIKL